MINLHKYENTFTQIGITADEANEIVGFLETLAQISIKHINKEGGIEL